MLKKPVQALIGAGANLPYRGRTPIENITAALKALNSIKIQIVGESRPWRSPSWPDRSKPAYINGVFIVETGLEPLDFLDCLHDVEDRFGRLRSERNAPRTLDLDIIDFDGMTCSAKESKALNLPHPRLRSRAFVLLPLRDVAPDWSHPEDGKRLSELIVDLDPAELNDCLPVESDAFSVVSA